MTDKWEADHQRAKLEYLDSEYGTSLAEEFPFGCDTIEAVAEALVEARSSLATLKQEMERLKEEYARGFNDGMAFDRERREEPDCTCGPHPDCDIHGGGTMDYDCEECINGHREDRRVGSEDGTGLQV